MPLGWGSGTRRRSLVPQRRKCSQFWGNRQASGEPLIDGASHLEVGDHVADSSPLWMRLTSAWPAIIAPIKKGKEGERGGGIIVYAYIDRKSNNYVPTIDHPLSGEGVDPAFSPEP